jgi:hypothetical protein
MPRQVRREFSGAIYHVLNGGEPQGRKCSNGRPTHLILAQKTHEMEINLMIAQGRPAQLDQNERNLKQASEITEI